MLVGVQGSLFHITVGSHPVHEAWGSQDSLYRGQIQKYARNTPGSICQYKEDGLVSRPPSLLTSMRQPMHGTTCPESQLKSTYLTAKFGSFLDHAETGEKGENVISSFVKLPISLIFALHVSFIIHLPMMGILLTKPMQKSVNTVCLHCSFARLKNKHIGVLGTNVATMSWLHWSPVSGYNSKVASMLSKNHTNRFFLL